MDYRYYDLERKLVSNDINLLFPGWRRGDEHIAVFSPHDDDALIGAGYAISAALDEGAKVHILIFCSGSAGYSTQGQGKQITAVRRDETKKAYTVAGISPENIIRFHLEDFSVYPCLGWKLPHGEEGIMSDVVRTLRKLSVTRVLIPNGYREHLDHEAVFKSAAYDAVQAADPVLASLGPPAPLRSLLQYSVWADFDPLNHLLFNHGLRADKAVAVTKQTELKIQAALQAFKSQKEIIKNLVESRQARKVKNSYIEVYVHYNARPALDLKPYRDAVRQMDKQNEKEDCSDHGKV